MSLYPQNGPSLLEANDQGHRFGNFPNYYTFHPPQNRLEVLENSNILNYIRNGLLMISKSTSYDEKKTLSNDDAPSDDGYKTGESATKKPRIENELSTNHQPQREEHIIYYCDLGCNEGDLTMAMANSLTKEKNTKGGESIEDNAKYSMASNSVPVKEVASIRCLGLDLDPMLIERANTKFSPPKVVDEQPSVSRTPSKVNIDACFKVCNLCSETEHNNACTSFTNQYDKLLHINNDTLLSPKETTTSQQRPIFHLTTIFSTTMWIHVHSGDDGLRDFLVRACSWTKRFILIEPQPSVWYVCCCCCVQNEKTQIVCMMRLYPYFSLS